MPGFRFLAAAVFLLAACGDDDGGPSPDAAPPVERFAGTPLGTDDSHFRDPEGRAVFLRGVNARVAGVFDVTFDDGRTAVEEIPPLTPTDCARLHELGFNFMRLPINWSGVEPERDQFSEAYLLNVDAAIECLASAEVMVLVDFHQDAWSKEIGEDGAPLWAIVPAPETLLEGPLTDLTERRTSPQVTKASDSFFAAGDPNGLQAEFLDALAHVAKRYKDHPAVVGFEIFNEPVVGADLLYPFTFAAAARLREVAPTKLVFFEPPSFRNQLDSQPLSDQPFPVKGAVYAPHIYTATGESFSIDDLEPSNDNARAEANAWKTPLYIGEFGGGPDAYGMKYVGLQYDLQDKYLASSTIWLWKENVQGSWGFYDYDAGSDQWSERPLVVATAARPYAQRVAGDPRSIQWDAAAGTLTVAFEGADVHAPHVIAVPAIYGLVGATCDGKSAATEGAPPTVKVSCGAEAGAHTLVVTVSRL
jgi:endoglycosylceramidase